MQTKTKKVKKTKKSLLFLIPPDLETKYKRRKSKMKLAGTLQRRIDKLKEERDAIDAELVPFFESHSNKGKLSNGNIVEFELKEIDERVATKKGQIIQSAYSYPQYHELAGE